MWISNVLLCVVIYDTYKAVIIILSKVWNIDYNNRISILR